MSRKAESIVLSFEERSVNSFSPGGGLPLRPGMSARQTRDYERSGTTTPFATLDMLNGKIIGGLYATSQASGIYAVSEKNRCRNSCGT